jgi:hypothetical protein
MKDMVLEAHKSFPDFLPASALQEQGNQHPQLFVTENIDGETVDLIVNRRENMVKVRVDGKGRGPDWKFWKDFFEATTGIEYLLKTTPIELCIVRCFSSRSPCFLKIIAISSVDSVTHKTKLVPFDRIEHFAKAVNMSAMPTTFHGKADFDHIKGMVNQPVLGVKRNGIIVIPDGHPVCYIEVPMNVDESVFRPMVEYDDKTMEALIEEFAARVFDVAEFKAEVTIRNDVERFVKAKINRASESFLLHDYVQRAEKEAGLKAAQAGALLKDAVIQRANRIWREGANAQAGAV